MTSDKNRVDLAKDLVLPTLMFAALGGMTWAVRGCSGFGAVAGCVFAGVMWGAAWWYLARDPQREQSRRYSSAWIVLALTFGIGLSGGRGWMQWPSFFEEKLMTNAGQNQFVPISRGYGFLWLFIAGMPWAGIGACALAWCGSLRETRICHWLLRIGCGVGVSLLGRALFDYFPQYFLPLYDSMSAQYQDLEANPSLKRLINDSGAAVTHMGYYLGFLLFEVLRRDWKNVVLILTVGIVNGAGWALCQCWKWAPGVWPTGKFNWWRCWESSGGISIGVALGIAYFLVNRPMSAPEREVAKTSHSLSGPNFEWLLIYLGLAQFLGMYARFQMGGWGNHYFSVVILFGTLYYLLYRRQPWGDEPDLAGGEPDKSGSLAGWGAVPLAGAMIAGLYLPELLDYFQFREMVWEGQRGLYRASLIYTAVVLGFGIAWHFLQRRQFEAERSRTTPPEGDPNLERIGLYVGVLAGLGLSLRNGLKGWFNIYMGDEKYWDKVLWQWLGPTYLAILILIVLWILIRPLSRKWSGDVFPHAYALLWLVLIAQNAIAQLVTGPLTEWTEVAFCLYYGLLFAITAVIAMLYRQFKTQSPPVIQT